MSLPIVAAGVRGHAALERLVFPQQALDLLGADPS